MPAPRDTPDTAEERPPCDRILGASPPRTLFPSPHPQQTTQNHSFRADSKRSWTKSGKYEYCYHFSSRQNHPKWRSCGSARPFQLTRMAGLEFGDPLLINRFLTMFIIFLVVNAIGKATVLIFGIFVHCHITNALWRAKNRPQSIAAACLESKRGAKRCNPSPAEQT